MVDHKSHVKKVGEAAKKGRLSAEKAFLEELKRKGSRKRNKRLDRLGQTGQWLTSMPNQAHGNILAPDEFRDGLFFRYGLNPKYLPKTCDGCGAAFSVTHAMSCKVGGLVGIRHDDVRDEWADLNA